MKLSSNFTLYGLNVKAIQAYLKDQGKCQRGVRISRRGDVVYIMTAYTGFKIPVMLYPDIVQPATFRECPEDGVTIVSGQYSYEVEKNAPVLAGASHRQKENRACTPLPCRACADPD